jgi:hypothetical protein
MKIFKKKEEPKYEIQIVQLYKEKWQEVFKIVKNLPQDKLKELIKYIIDN